MELDIFAHGDRQWEKDFLANYNLNIKLFEKMNLNIKQIIPVRSVFRIATDKGFYCLKKLRFSEQEMNFIVEAIEHLKRKGFDNVLEIVPQNNDNAFIEFEGDKYFITQWIDGRECDYSNPMDVKSATEALADLHNFSKGFEPSCCPSNRNYLGKWNDSFKKKIKEMKKIKQIVLSKHEKSSFDNIYLDNVDVCISDAENALSMLEKTKYKELVEKAKVQKGFIHHDYAHHNIIQTFKSETYIVDFDFCVLDIRIHDLGSLIIRNMKKSNWDIDKAMEIIEAYNNKSNIDHSELEVLMAFFLFPQDFWMISRQYYIEKKPWEEQDYIEKMNKKSQYSDYRKMFLKQFIKEI